MGQILYTIYHQNSKCFNVWRVTLLTLLFCSFHHVGNSQAPIYDDCTKAFELCPFVSSNVNNIDATKLQFPGSPDVFPASFCFTANNTVWLKFYTNETGGEGQVVFSNIQFQNEIGQDNRIQALILDAAAACDASTYTPISNCESGTTAGFTLTANLAPLKVYYVVLNGAMSGVGITQAAEFSTDVFLLGPGVTRPQPIISITADKDSICRDEIITFSTELKNCPDSSFYEWTINDVLVATTIDTFFQTTAVQKGDVVKVTNSCYQSCKIYPSAEISSFEVIQIEVDAGEDREIEYGESIQLNGTTNTSTYQWYPSDNLFGDKSLTPTVSPKESTLYYLQADSLQCSYTDAVFVKVGLNLEIMNTFSPNNDGINDKWEIPGLSLYPNCLVEIYSRWGQLVYSATSYTESKAWDGKNKGKLMSESVYYYVIQLRDKDENVLRGTLTLIR
ncbi:MAG: gliding motility-associated C-terminal domain-containing protein [Flavobacteriia bacterium]|nr:gliding motility-associated C-terminal domain-containing protein [Flavobacteriia bacterium]